MSGFGFRPEQFIGLAVYAIIAGVALCIHIVVCIFLYSFYKRVPAPFRKMEPGMVWLLLIPCFNFVWNFFAFPRLSKSLQAYFASVGNTAVGDCGEGLALGYSVCEVATLIPCVGLLVWIAAIVLLIIFLMKTNDLTKRIPATP
jgi:hypothetical protein